MVSPLVRRLSLAVAVVLLASCASPDRPPSPSVPRTLSFEEWRRMHAQEVSDFQAWLQLEGVDGLVPLPQLLRTATSWYQCGGQPFEVPPRSQWESVGTVLHLIQTLQADGVLGTFQVHSAYRSPNINACVGGARRSAHALAFALDLTPGLPDGDGRLCGFWADKGRDWRMGLGRYPTGRLHIDTFGYRSWGPDGTWKTSTCPGAKPMAF
jgi:Peptidase M15